VRSIRRCLAAVLCTLVAGSALADSAVTSLALGSPTLPADCTSNANVTWSFTYTSPPTTEFFSITTPTGPIGGFQLPSTVGSTGSFTGVFNAPIAIPQPPNTLIGTYGSVGDLPPTVNTAEFFVLYNCTTRQVLYQCQGNAGKCPRAASVALGLISPAIPVDTPALVLATIVVLGGVGAWRLRRPPRG
jgi:hypothetical protein